MCTLYSITSTGVCIVGPLLVYIVGPLLFVHHMAIFSHTCMVLFVPDDDSKLSPQQSLKSGKIWNLEAATIMGML